MRWTAICTFTLVVLTGMTCGTATGQERILADPGAPRDPAGLTREVQKELYRLGCYDEAINGIWTPSTRAAAQKFLQRANARLPVDKPDEALLALVQSSKGFICTQCGTGEAFDAAGRCVPKALIAKAPSSAAVTAGTLADASSPTDKSAGKHAEPRETVVTGQRASANFSGEKKYWRSLLRSVDRTLGFN